MTPTAAPADLELAIRLAHEVAPLSMKWFNSVDQGVRSKADGSPVTEGDLATERKLRELLADADPDASILGEEEGWSGGTNGRKWFLDPIDGTTSFAHGVPLWSTLIALHDEHGPAVGVISSPGVNELVVAGRGLGCKLNGKATSVSSQASLQGGVVTTWGYEEWTGEMLEELKSRGPRLRGWSDAWGWSLVATGRADVVIDFGVKPWDLAPMQVILPEAGGRFSAFDGSESLENGNGLGTNGILHDEMLDVIKKSEL